MAAFRNGISTFSYGLKQVTVGRVYSPFALHAAHQKIIHTIVITKKLPKIKYLNVIAFVYLNALTFHICKYFSLFYFLMFYVF